MRARAGFRQRFWASGFVNVFSLLPNGLKRDEGLVGFVPAYQRLAAKHLSWTLIKNWEARQVYGGSQNWGGRGGSILGIPIIRLLIFLGKMANSN